MPLLELVNELTEKEQEALYSFLTVCRSISGGWMEDEHGAEVIKAFKEAWIFIAISSRYETDAIT